MNRFFKAIIERKNAIAVVGIGYLVGHFSQPIISESVRAIYEYGYSSVYGEPTPFISAAWWAKIISTGHVTSYAYNYYWNILTSVLAGGLYAVQAGTRQFITKRKEKKANSCTHVHSTPQPVSEPKPEPKPTVSPIIELGADGNPIVGGELVPISPVSQAISIECVPALLPNGQTGLVCTIPGAASATPILFQGPSASPRRDQPTSTPTTDLVASLARETLEGTKTTAKVVHKSEDGSSHATMIEITKSSSQIASPATCDAINDILVEELEPPKVKLLT